ncbi:MAG: STAS domain-containing protein [Phycisphaerae bacterium]|nr:STAS domain-containing protein [Phycisphaerae bacterium]
MFSATSTTDPATGGLVVTLVGDADMSAMPALDRATSLAAAQRPTVVVIDGHGLTFMASLAMGSLVALHNALHASGRRVVIAGPSRPILELIQRAKLDTLFPIYESTSLALAAFAPSTAAAKG